MAHQGYADKDPFHYVAELFGLSRPEVQTAMDVEFRRLGARDVFSGIILACSSRLISLAEVTGKRQNAPTGLSREQSELLCMLAESALRDGLMLSPNYFTKHEVQSEATRAMMRGIAGTYKVHNPAQLATVALIAAKHHLNC